MLYAFIAYVARVVEPLIQITMQFSLLQQSVIAASRVDALLHEPEAPRSTSARRIGAGHVEFADVSFGYDPERPVLHDVSLDIPAGSFVGIVGPTGSGKSTLLSLLLRFYAPQSGRIDVDGIPLGDIDAGHFREAVGLVPQEPFLLAASVRENIDMGRGLPDADDRRARRARPARTTSSRGFRRATQPSSAKAARACRRDRSSSSPSRARSPDRRACCCSTRRRRASTARPSRPCARRSRTWRSSIDGHRDRAPVVHDSRGRSHRRAAARPHRRVGNARRADGDRRRHLPPPLRAAADRRRRKGQSLLSVSRQLKGTVPTTARPARRRPSSRWRALRARAGRRRC